MARRYLKAKYPHLEEIWKDIQTPEEFEVRYHSSAFKWAITDDCVSDSLLLMETASFHHLVTIPPSLFIDIHFFLQLAREVDRIEASIKTRIPGAKYIDLETD